MKLENTAEILGDLEKGDLAKDFFEEITKLGKALSQEDKASGSVTLKLTMSVDGEMVAIKPQIDTKLPKSKRKTSGYFLDPTDGKLSKQSVNQIDMFPSRRKAQDAEAH